MNMWHIITKIYLLTVNWHWRRFHLIPTLLISLMLGACWSDSSLQPGKPTSIPTVYAPLKSSLAYPPPLSPVYPPPYPTPETYRPTISARTANRYTPYFTPTPVVHWDADVIEVNWNAYSAVSQPEWLSNTVAKLAIFPAESSDGYITVDISSGKEARAVGESINSDWRIYSPQRTFVIECISGMKMYRAGDNQLISETPLLPPLSPGVICSTFIQWAPDESVASFMAGDHSIYTWKSDGTLPEKVIDHTSSAFTAWSPDSRKLAVEVSETVSHIGTINVIDADGKILSEFQFQAGGDGAILGWLTNDVMASYSRYTNWFYDIHTGQQLFTWTNTPSGGVVHQHPQVSPNNHWVFLEQGDEERFSTLNTNRIIMKKEYRLFDIQKSKDYLLLDDWGNYLLFAGWNTDATTLYLVNRPAEANSTSKLPVPFGLVGYDVQTQQYHLLFKDAVQVAWNADKSWGFVVFAASDKADQLGLYGGLWKVGATTLVKQWHISGQMVYQDPALDSFFGAFPGPVSIAWSHNNKTVTVNDKFGRVKIINTDGVEHILTDNMPGKNVALRWSPDDQHLLVETDNRAWIVTIPNP